MSLTLIIVLVVALIIGLYAGAIYNNLVRLKHQVAKAWSNIDVVLKQRHDELPNLVAVCREYMRYEQETLQRVVEARSAVSSALQRGDVRGVGQAEEALRGGLGRLFALAEHYPDLKANASFQQLSQRISYLEDSIADRRELYNDSVNVNNMRIEQLPDLLIARLFAFKAVELLQFAEAREAVDVRGLFGHQ
ncbi:LemA family protein [Lamprobacter modestohalophilus]|uniref:LemA family protein n=1 Tax=Lamprobacter modestohalophilus TaxID=1064514 RepID=UPI002ADEB180|nr:LemA family protein [Lamprobacter modestohalophilus]MEA1049226.1 LemA family protein [Lamprobacter modestohalophilus]